MNRTDTDQVSPATVRCGRIGELVRDLVLIGYHDKHNPGIGLTAKKRLLVMPVIYFRHGINYRYPLCCVLRFALSGQRAQGRHRGSRVNRRPGPGNCAESMYVVCGLFHRPDPQFQPDIDDHDRDHLYRWPQSEPAHWWSPWVRIKTCTTDQHHSHPECARCVAVGHHPTTTRPNTRHRRRRHLG